MLCTTVAFAVLLILGTVDASSSHAAWQAAGCPRNNVPRARDTRVPHPLPTCANMDSLAAVRCCGPQQCTSVCRRDADETCALTSIDSRLTSFAEAGAECAAHGRRLCTRRELEDGKCCRAGCNMDGVLAWSSDECASITARPPVAAPASTSTPAALPCAVATPRGFGPCCDRGSLRASPNDALLNFSFLKRHPSGYLDAAHERLPVKKAKEAKKLRADEARLCSSADGRACSFNPTIEQAMALLGPAPQRGTFVDVGANGGWETRHALAAGMDVLAVECLPEAYQELLVIFSGVPAARLRLLHACASNSTGVATLHRAADSSSMIVSNVRSGPEALKAGKERNKESRVHSVVLDSELLPTGTPDSASLRVDVRLVKIDTQVAPRHEPTYANAIALAAGSTPPAYFPPSPYPLYRAAGERAARAIRIAPHSPHVATPHIFREQPNGGCFTRSGRSDAVDRAIKLHLHARSPGHALRPCRASTAA